jgi:hypothetical protein
MACGHEIRVTIYLGQSRLQPAKKETPGCNAGVKNRLVFQDKLESRLRDLNPGPQLYESCALPLS